MATTKTATRKPATRSRSTTSRTAGTSTRTYPGVLAVLKEEHDEVKKLFDRFEKETKADPAAGKATADQICMELVRHAEMEEKIVYPALQQEDEEVYHEAHEEHHVAEMLVKEIQSMRPDGAWKAKVTVLGENVKHHIEEEEKEGFKELRKAGKSKLDAMAESWKQMKAQWKPSTIARAS